MERPVQNLCVLKIYSYVMNDKANILQGTKKITYKTETSMITIPIKLMEKKILQLIVIVPRMFYLTGSSNNIFAITLAL